MNLFPLCTAKVCPTNSGSTVLARDQVLITRFSLLALSASTFLPSASCTNGPFLTLLPISRISVWVAGCWLLVVGCRYQQPVTSDQQLIVLLCRACDRGRSCAATTSSCCGSSRLPSCPTG